MRRHAGAAFTPEEPANVNRRAHLDHQRRSTYPEVFGGLFPAVSRHLVAYLSALIQAAQTCSLDGRDMDEHVLAASVGLNKSIALRRIEPLHCAYRHVVSPLDSRTS